MCSLTNERSIFGITFFLVTMFVIGQTSHMARKRNKTSTTTMLRQLSRCHFLSLHFHHFTSKTVLPKKILKEMNVNIRKNVIVDVIIGV